MPCTQMTYKDVAEDLLHWFHGRRIVVGFCVGENMSPSRNLLTDVHSCKKFVLNLFQDKVLLYQEDK